MKKNLFILVGPKGSGKTYIGRLVDQQTAIKFLEVEQIWIKNLNAQVDDDFILQIISNEIDRLFVDHDAVMVESLGVGRPFEHLINHASSRYFVKLIQVKSSLATCFSRIRNRDAARQIHLPDDKLRQYNKIASQVSHEWDLIIDNETSAADGVILEAFKRLL